MAVVGTVDKRRPSQERTGYPERVCEQSALLPPRGWDDHRDRRGRVTRSPPPFANRDDKNRDYAHAGYP